MIAARTFGIELECHLPDRRTARGLCGLIRRRAGVVAECEQYNHQTRPHWKLTTDASLGPRSVEVVSPVLSGEEGIAEARRVVDAMREFGCRVSVRCGFHVHVYAGDMNADQLRALAINFVHCETAFDAIVPPSRRRDLNQYVLSNRTAFGGHYDNEAINRAVENYKLATDIPSLIQRVSGCGMPANTTRYRKLNMTSYNRYRTVEFRQHGGTVDADKVENWVRVCVGFVEKCLRARPRQRPSQKPHDPSKELSMLLTFVGAEPAVRRFYHERRKMLAAASLTAAE
ncbi:amidoligase family protein [Rhodoplanes sp. TEM]|uniref:Amidoligase family protein n=1 Tax=Rhodoplanes tepidamans TaxID=200616 RepID=A0ABT5J580_RHOTP|nr:MULTISPECIES: amidoligase family protein [Rhodoplanes]MDC7784780.1 amidoligase family protein [Rhodoplanes tepidamans]MDC7982247.1 amidoligase family protein [Rhodoplanes sp. TEM]MDQ0356254.1 hypothetical protein [Rhodoplanes tepidamans]